jgi:hypothetical protein
MRRTWRIFPNALTMLSLVLCLASAALWVRSYWRVDEFSWYEPQPHAAEAPFLTADSGGGGLGMTIGFNSVDVMRGWLVEGRRWDARPEESIVYADGRLANGWGFGHGSQRSAGGRWIWIVFPLWLPTILFATLPLARGALFIRRRRRVREGHCRKCGYDLRATPDRCPECGSAPARPPAPAARTSAPPSPS